MSPPVDILLRPYDTAIKIPLCSSVMSFLHCDMILSSYQYLYRAINTSRCLHQCLRSTFQGSLILPFHPQLFTLIFFFAMQHQQHNPLIRSLHSRLLSRETLKAREIFINAGCESWIAFDRGSFAVNARWSHCSIFLTFLKQIYFLLTFHSISIFSRPRLH